MISKRWQNRISKMSEKDWADVISYSNSENQAFENTVDEIFTHMIDHSTYHVGQFMSGVRAMGLNPKPCTLIFYLRETQKETIQ